MIPLITIVGNSNSGKTTHLTKLIAELKIRGYLVGTMKHASHGFEMDHKGKDSYLHKQAGASMTLVSSPGRIGIVKDEASDHLDDLRFYFKDVDIILCEGFKRENYPKIEIFRKDIHEEPIFIKDKNLIAMVTDSDIDPGAPVFGLSEIKSLCEFIIDKFLIP